MWDGCDNAERTVAGVVEDRVLANRGVFIRRAALVDV